MADTYEPTRDAPKMLIADDDPSIVRLLADRCGRVGFKVETATNGVQALMKIRRTQPDILVIDVNMPEADGLTVCAHVLDSARKDLNVIVVTGSRDPEMLERCEGFGAFYVRKGPEFWRGLAEALIELFPGMAHQIRELATPLSGGTGTSVTRKRSRVLLIDDDPDVKALLSSRLGKFGVDMLYASDALQGYKMACRDEPSAIIMECYMPNGGADYLLTRLRTTPATEYTPVIILSGQQLDPKIRTGLTREFCGRPGAARVLRKSLDTSELFEALQQFCGFEKESGEEMSLFLG